MHDLLRLFACERALQQEQVTTRRWRLSGASALVQPADLRWSVGGDVGGVGLSDRRDALAWPEAERGNLIASARQAAEERRFGGAVAASSTRCHRWQTYRRTAIILASHEGSTSATPPTADCSAASYRCGLERNRRAGNVRW